MSKSKSRILVQGFTAELRKGELTCLIGTNGVGKSTILRTLAGFQSPLEGTLQLDGRSLNDYSSLEIARKIGVVLTDKISSESMTVEEVVSLGRMPYTGVMGRLNEMNRNEVRNAMEKVGVSKFANCRLCEMSDGEKQKVILAKALAQHTEVILLDEPTSFLDYPSKVQILYMLRDLAQKENLSILFSTHDLELAFRIANRFWVIGEEGRWEVGTLQEIQDSGILAPFHYNELRENNY